MIATQRLGALLRALIRDDVLTSRLRTPAAAAVRGVAAIGAELPPPLQDATTPEAPPRDPARAAPRAGSAPPREPAAAALRDTVHITSRLAGDFRAAAELIADHAAAPAVASRSPVNGDSPRR